MKATMLPYWLALIVVLASSYALWHVLPSVRATKDDYARAVLDSLPEEPATQADPLTNFTLTERSGQPLESKALDGDVWVASFFFTECQSACFRLNQALQAIENDPELAAARLVSISCDPENDTPDVLSQYAERFDADPQRWLFCTGELDYVQRVGRDMFQLGIERKTHGSSVVVIDRSGKLRGHFDVLDPAQYLRLRKVLKTCLAEPSPEDDTQQVSASAEESPAP